MEGKPLGLLRRFFPMKIGGCDNQRTSTSQKRSQMIRCWNPKSRHRCFRSHKGAKLWAGGNDGGEWPGPKGTEGFSNGIRRPPTQIFKIPLSGSQNGQRTPSFFHSIELGGCPGGRAQPPHRISRKEDGLTFFYPVNRGLDLYPSRHRLLTPFPSAESERIGGAPEGPNLLMPVSGSPSGLR